MKIKNFNELAKTEARRRALFIAEAGLAAIDTANVMRQNVKISGDVLRLKDVEILLGGAGRILVVAVGKCALGASAALEEVLGGKISAGIALDVKKGRLRKIKSFAGTHPLPSDGNMMASKEIVNLLSGLEEKDLVIFVISGGGSTLLCLPDSARCLEETLVVKALMSAGATIQETNAVRKHLSLARGGFLAKYAYPARAVALIFSDVPGDDTQFIASGPTVKDMTTIKDAEEILAKYDVFKTCNIHGCGLVETPKDDMYFARVTNMVVVSNKVALEAMKKKAGEFGFAVKICTNCLVGEARDVGLNTVSELGNAPPKTALLYGGETTVTIRHDGGGKGGRNLELALSALRKIGEGELILTLASDGRDNTDLAGAICDTMSRERAAEAELDPEKYLDQNNSYEFWQKAGGYLSTGDTGSNVSDLIIALKE